MAHDQFDESLHTPLIHELWQAVNEAGVRAEDLDPVYAASLQQLDELDGAGRSRMLIGRERLPEAMILTLTIGAIITVGFSYLFAVEERWIQGLMTASLATLVSLLLLLEYQLDTPYEGVSAIEPTAMELVRTEIDAGLGTIGGGAVSDDIAFLMTAPNEPMARFWRSPGRRRYPGAGAAWWARSGRLGLGARPSPTIFMCAKTIWTGRGRSSPKTRARTSTRSERAGFGGWISLPTDSALYRPSYVWRGFLTTYLDLCEAPSCIRRKFRAPQRRMQHDALGAPSLAVGVPRRRGTPLVTPPRASRRHIPRRYSRHPLRRKRPSSVTSWRPSPKSSIWPRRSSIRSAKQARQIDSFAANRRRASGIGGVAAAPGQAPAPHGVLLPGLTRIMTDCVERGDSRRAPG